jgi:hypothetical protein
VGWVADAGARSGRRAFFFRFLTESIETRKPQSSREMEKMAKRRREKGNRHPARRSPPRLSDLRVEQRHTGAYPTSTAAARRREVDVR